MRLSKGIMANSFLVLMNLMFPALLLFLFEQIKVSKLSMEKVLLNIFTLNCCMAIVEFAMKSHFIGWYENTYADGYVSFNDSAFRSVALWGGFGKCRTHLHYKWIPAFFKHKKEV